MASSDNFAQRQFASRCRTRRRGYKGSTPYCIGGSIQVSGRLPVKFLGVTPPITTDPPKPNDIKSSEALMADLVALNQFESDQERKVRERLLSNIAQLVAKFVHDVSIKLGMSEKIASEAGGRIYTSGSYRLGVHGPGSDIDTICPRVTDMILNLVPDVATFRTALRTIRLWAKRRGIYSNVLGFPGGVAWALLTARICQLYPAAAPATIVGKFFPIYYQWNWPQPVLLKKIDNGPPNMQHSVWNPKLDRRDQAHRMPVITPAYPSMCSTHNITSSTMSIIRKEMLRAMQITDEILKTPGSSWIPLFEKVDFFSMYKTYVQVVASASTSDGIKDWSGMVESRIRTLVGDLENTDCIITAHPQVGGVNRVFYCLTEEEQAAASQGELTAEMIDRTEEDVEGKEHRKIYTKSFFIGLEIEKKSKETGGRVLNLFYPSKKFCAVCQNWDKYNEMEMSVILRPAKRSELPPYVFPDGMPRSKKKTKRQQQNGSEDAGMNDGSEGQGPSKRTKSEQTSFNNSEPQQQLPNGIPVPNGADPVPLKDGTGPVDFKPPPGIEDMPPLSTAAMSSFATAAKGVANPQDENKEGLVVLNQSAPASS
ncbi:poly(A) polymerase [Cryptococcus deuterogattii CA1014]|nr:poly(A) polymerase [Cryptococcus deuterogattii CA1014]